MVRSRAPEDCPCTSGRRYAACCRDLHRGAEAVDPVALMRSRFAAFAMGDGEYLVRTLHPDHPSMAEPRPKLVRELSRARQTLRYRRLEVHDHSVDGERARVLFTAHVFSRGRDRSFTELSSFERRAGAWRYVDGVTRSAEEGVDSIEAFEA